ncbi:MAG: F0F1 ATP synthase subunit alpha [Dehalococcoidia bacterium]|nr:MAG: F0F1 ATP synthase subunit alpha [Dehalococcoidia bacterium]
MGRSFTRRIAQYVDEPVVKSVGVVTQVGDSVARLRGLGNVGSQELLEFSGGVLGMAMNLESDAVSAVLLGDNRLVREGDEVRSTGRVVEVPVGDALLGRIIDPLGRPLDGKGPITATRSRPIEHLAPDVTKRAPVDTPLHTGFKAIDSMIPIGRGQRELIIGDRTIGKSAIAVDTISAQKHTGVVSVYVAIGKKISQVAYIAANLRKTGAFDRCVVVAAGAAEPAPLQYLAPYAGCAIAEEFMEHGGDTLVVYDDLTKHAWAYRELSLLLRRPPGREAYPGDVFYLHSRLLERAGKLSPQLGGGSMTALPIVETQAGDFSAYVPTNLISITDGQIYLETSLFNAGVRPAVNVGLSVSRVGGAAQSKAMRQVAGRLRLELAQFRELEAFAQFGSADLDKSARQQIERGRRIVEVLKQSQYAPMSLGHEVVIIYAVTNGYLDGVPVSEVKAWEEELHKFVSASRPELLRAIEADQEIRPDTETLMQSVLLEYRAGAK